MPAVLLQTDAPTVTFTLKRVFVFQWLWAVDSIPHGSTIFKRPALTAGLFLCPIKAVASNS